MKHHSHNLEKILIKRYLNELLNKCFSVNPYIRRGIFLIIDTLLITLSLQLSFLFYSTNENNFISLGYFEWMIPVGIFIGIPIFALTGQYKAITRFTGRKTIYRIIFRNFLILILQE